MNKLVKKHLLRECGLIQSDILTSKIKTFAELKKRFTKDLIEHPYVSRLILIFVIVKLHALVCG